MSDKRIPISLKVPEDEFFYDFIEPKRINKELSPFIYQVLRAYFEDSAVRDAINPHLSLSGNDRIDFINRELGRIAMEHSQTVMESYALQDEAEAKKNMILEKVENLYGSVKTPEDSPFDDAKVERKMLLLAEAKKSVEAQSIESNDIVNTMAHDDFEDRMSTMEANIRGMQTAITDMTQQFSNMMQMILNQHMSNKVEIPDTQSKVIDNQSVEEKPVIEVNKPAVSISLETGTKDTVSQSIAQGVDTEPVVEVQFSEKSAEVQEEKVQVPTESVHSESKPLGFSKLMSSLHK